MQYVIEQLLGGNRRTTAGHADQWVIDLKTIEKLMINRSFGCLTRNAFDLYVEQTDLVGLAAVYWDVNELKKANDTWGKPESSRRIYEALAAVRTRTSDAVFQFFSGDEFVAVLAPAQALGFANRIQAELEAMGLSATFVIKSVEPGSVIEQVEALSKVVDELKACGRRGAIVEC